MMIYHSNPIRICCLVIFSAIITAFLLYPSNSVAIDYEQGDWVEYTEFKHITSIAADQRVVYFGTTGGIIRYDRFSKSWLYPLTKAGGLPSNYVKKLAYEPNYNELWVQTDRGTAKYNVTFETWYPEFDFPSGLVKNSWNQARFPTLITPFEYDYMDGYIVDKHMRKYPITVGFEDIDDLMYVGTWGMGPAIINTRYLDFEPIAYGPYNYNISAVIDLGGQLWMGNDYSLSDRGITRYSLDTRQWEYYEPQTTWGLNSAEVTSGMITGDCTWLGTRDGLLRVDGNNSFRIYNQFSGLPSEHILSLAEYGGFIYIGTDNGLGIMHSSGDVPDSLFKSPLPDKFLLRGFRINDLLVFKNNLYIAASDGVFMFNSDSSQFKNLDTPTGDLSYGANDIFTDGKNLYFAARFGVVVIDTETDNASVATDPSLSDRWRILRLYSDKKYIWAATSIGLWRYRKSDETTRLYTVADGLPTNYINSLVGDGDYLWLGTQMGLIRFLWNSSGRGD